MRAGWIAAAGLCVLLAGAGSEATGGRGGPSSPAADGLPPLTAPDSLRTNLWLVQALLAETAREAARLLPEPPGAVHLRAVRNHEANALYAAAAFAALSAQGYTVYEEAPPPAGGAGGAAPPAGAAGSSAPAAGLAAAAAAAAALDSAPADSLAGPHAEVGQAAAAATEPVSAPDTTAAPPAGAGYGLRYAIETLQLSYPRSGRRYGLWRQWVERDLKLAVLITLTDRATGRVIHDGRIVRAYSDRVPAGDFASVRAPTYPFTDAGVPEAGWRRHLEQAVVLGTLAGLVAIYFANSGS